jgi:hypothetical protein
VAPITKLSFHGPGFFTVVTELRMENQRLKEALAEMVVRHGEEFQVGCQAPQLLLVLTL